MSSLLSLSLVCILVFLVAALYSSVGHGGASGYLAVLSLFGIATAEMSSTALILNLLVAGVGAYSYWKAKHLSIKLAWPFLILSVPAAYIGGLLKVSDKTYFFLLAGALVVAAYRLATARTSPEKSDGPRTVPVSAAVPLGGAIGLLSGGVGIGGGIFLSPLMIFFNWADPKKTAAVSALFIWVNSLAGLGGRLTRDAIVLGNLAPLLVAAFIGGLMGSYYGANRFSGLMLRRILAVVLIVAVFKLIIAAL